jgi:hypothetical protein
VTTSPGQVAGATQQAAGQTATTAKDEAAQVGQAAASAASDVAGTAKQQAGQVAGEAVNQLRSLTDDARAQASQQASQATEQLSTKVRALAGEMRDLGQGRGDANGTVAGLVQQLADRGEQLADQIAARGPGGLVQDLRSYAARKPGTFLLGALAAGVVTGRLVKGATADSGSGGTPTGTTGTGYGATPYPETSDLSLTAAPPVAPVTPVAATQQTTYLDDLPVAHSDDSGILDEPATTAVGPVSGDDRLRAESGLDDLLDGRTERR